MIQFYSTVVSVIHSTLVSIRGAREADYAKRSKNILSHIEL